MKVEKKIRNIDNGIKFRIVRENKGSYFVHMLNFTAILNIELEISRLEGRKQSPVYVRSWSSEYDMIKAFIVDKYDEVDFRYGWLNHKANHGDPRKLLDTNRKSLLTGSFSKL